MDAALLALSRLDGTVLMWKELSQFAINVETQSLKQLIQKFAMMEILLQGMDALLLVKLGPVIHVLTLLMFNLHVQSFVETQSMKLQTQNNAMTATK